MEASRPATTPWPDQSPADAHAAGGPDSLIDERPEVLVGAAFAGGLALAGLLHWLGNR
ncbi:MAG: hypothetical protein ACR2J6_09160 [Thermoleophilaceae bacterium]